MHERGRFDALTAGVRMALAVAVVLPVLAGWAVAQDEGVGGAQSRPSGPASRMERQGGAARPGRDA